MPPAFAVPIAGPLAASKSNRKEPMPTHLESLIEQSAARNRFPPSSRYHGAPVLGAEDADGRPVVYAGRRFIPEVAPGEDTLHTVTEGERPDHLANRHLGDPLRYWELCDHNLVMRPWKLTGTAGETVLVPGSGPTGAPGASFFSM